MGNMMVTFRRDQRAQSTVEFVLVLPLVVLVVLVVLQVGLVVRDSLIVHDLAREAARAAAVNPSRSAAEQAVWGANSRLEAQRLVVSIEGGALPGELITATVDYDSPTNVPLVGIGIADVPLSAAVTMRIEASPP